MLHILAFSVVLAASGTSSSGRIIDRIQPDIDTFVFCVLDESVERLSSPLDPEIVAESAASACQSQLKSLQDATERVYQEVNADVWSTELVEETAAKDTMEFRKLAIKAAIKVISERRSSK